MGKQRWYIDGEQGNKPIEREVRRRVAEEVRSGTDDTCHGQEGHDGPHFHFEASWPDGNCYKCEGEGNGGPLAAGGRCTKCNGTGKRAQALKRAKGAANE